MSENFRIVRNKKKELIEVKNSTDRKTRVENVSNALAFLGIVQGISFCPPQPKVLMGKGICWRPVDC